MDMEACSARRAAPKLRLLIGRNGLPAALIVKRASAARAVHWQTAIGLDRIGAAMARPLDVCLHNQTAVVGKCAITAAGALIGNGERSGSRHRSGQVSARGR